MKNLPLYAMILAASVLATGCASIPKAPVQMIMDCTTESTATKSADGGTVRSETRCPMVTNPAYTKWETEHSGSLTTGEKIGIGAGVTGGLLTIGAFLLIFLTGSASSDHVSQEVCVGPRCR